MIEWYDFFIFGSLATILATQFYPAGNPTANFLKDARHLRRGLCCPSTRRALLRKIG